MTLPILPRFDFGKIPSAKNKNKKRADYWDCYEATVDKPKGAEALLKNNN